MDKLEQIKLYISTKIASYEHLLGTNDSEIGESVFSARKDELEALQAFIEDKPAKRKRSKKQESEKQETTDDSSNAND